WHFAGAFQAMLDLADEGDAQPVCRASYQSAASSNSTRVPHGSGPLDSSPDAGEGLGDAPIQLCFLGFARCRHGTATGDIVPQRIDQIQLIGKAEFTSLIEQFRVYGAGINPPHAPRGSDSPMNSGPLPRPACATTIRAPIA